MSRTKNVSNNNQVFYQRHLSNLKALVGITGSPYASNIRVLYEQLRGIEVRANKNAENYCNLPNWGDRYESNCDIFLKKVQYLFNNNLKGVFMNGDPRGYSIKIDAEDWKKEYPDLRMFTDMGGYIILAPDFSDRD